MGVLIILWTETMMKGCCMDCGGVRGNNNTSILQLSTGGQRALSCLLVNLEIKGGNSHSCSCSGSKRGNKMLQSRNSTELLIT